MNWYLEVLRKYAVFDGRARRTEFWLFFLFNCIIALVLSIIEAIVGITSIAGASIFGSLYMLAVFIPYLAVGVRRLHDTGRSGWWMLISFVPIIGSIVLLVFFVQDSQDGHNQYGPNPKAFPV